MKSVGSILAILFLCSTAFAEITSRAKDIVIVQPKDLPELAQTAGQAMELRSLGNGSTYLYIEQHTLGRIAILDVTDPAHIREVGVVRIQAPGTFDFVRSLGGSAELISFREGGGTAILDFRKPKEPVLILSETLQQATRFESVGETGLLMSNVPDLRVGTLPHDCQIIDVAEPQAPRVLLKVQSVGKKLTNPDTGTTFLLSPEGLTVIRQPKVEEAYQTEQSATN